MFALQRAVKAGAMKERTYVVRQEADGWTVSLAGKTIAEPFAGREQAIAAASSAVAKSRAAGCYAWLKVMHSETLGADHHSFPQNESGSPNRTRTNFE